MSDKTSLYMKIEKNLKDRFYTLCQEEGIDVSQGIRELIMEALARGYVNKERKDMALRVNGDRK
jgi:antitoxin component of RelBE/YafQ-DinJ toxin-antitoxin module